MNIVKFNSKLDISIIHTHMSSRKQKKDIFPDSGFHHALSPSQVDINDKKSSRTQMRKTNRNYSTEGRRFRTVS
jgi:hypothetical protein